ncbi:Mothers against decapentaplegic [Schistosoma japonicum]|nr:Mothers against decapentaplegic [Schistosoma japonicum]
MSGRGRNVYREQVNILMKVRIGPCQFSQNHIHSQICLNPYHWSRVLVQNKIDEKLQCSRYSSDPSN